MDKDRVEGAAKKITGGVKETVGRAVGDTKMEADGQAERTEGKLQNAIGGIKDTVRELVGTKSKE